MSAGIACLHGWHQPIGAQIFLDPDKNRYVHSKPHLLMIGMCKHLGIIVYGKRNCQIHGHNDDNENQNYRDGLE